MTLVTFIRHGQSLENVGGVTGETATVPLTDTGRRQAVQIKNKLVTRMSKPPLFIMTSPYVRAKDTVIPTSQIFPHCQVVEEANLREFNYLDFGEEQTTQEQRLEKRNQYWSQMDPDYRDGKKESFADFITRVQGVLTKLNSLCKELKDDDREILIFTHGHFMKALQLIHKTVSIPDMKSLMTTFLTSKISFKNGQMLQFTLPISEQ